MANNTPFDPHQIIQMIKQGKNPEQVMMYYLQSSLSNSPFGQNIIQMAKNNDKAGIEKVVRNLCEQRGINFDAEFNAFKQNLGL